MMRVRHLDMTIALFATVLFCGATMAAAAVPDGILIIHSNQRPTPAAIVIEDTMRKVVPDLLKRPVEIYSEYLDIERTPMEGYADAEAEFLRKKYAGRNIRVIVASAPDAVRFAIGSRDRMLPGVPVVHIALPRDQLQRMALPPDVVGRTVDLDPSATLDLALRLHPDAERLVIVLGAAERDRLWGQRVRAAVPRLKRPIEVEYLSGLPTAEVQRRLGALPPSDHRLHTGILRRRRGQRDHSASIGGADRRGVRGPGLWSAGHLRRSRHRRRLRGAVRRRRRRRPPPSPSGC